MIVTVHEKERKNLLGKIVKIWDQLDLDFKKWCDHYRFIHTKCSIEIDFSDRTRPQIYVVKHHMGKDLRYHVIDYLMNHSARPLARAEVLLYVKFAPLMLEWINLHGGHLDPFDFEDEIHWYQRGEHSLLSIEEEAEILEDLRATKLSHEWEVDPGSNRYWFKLSQRGQDLNYFIVELDFEKPVYYFTFGWLPGCGDASRVGALGHHEECVALSEVVYFYDKWLFGTSAPRYRPMASYALKLHKFLLNVPPSEVPYINLSALLDQPPSPGHQVYETRRQVMKWFQPVRAYIADQNWTVWGPLNKKEVRIDATNYKEDGQPQHRFITLCYDPDKHISWLMVTVSWYGNVNVVVSGEEVLRLITSSLATLDDFCTGELNKLNLGREVEEFFWTLYALTKDMIQHKDRYVFSTSDLAALFTPSQEDRRLAIAEQPIG